jgi:hypothetical protein
MEEHKLRGFENRKLRIISGPKNKEELHNLYASPNIRVIKARGIRWDR